MSPEHFPYLYQSPGHTYQLVLHMSSLADLQALPCYSHLALDVPLRRQIHLAPVGRRQEKGHYNKDTKELDRLLEVRKKNPCI